PPAPGPAPAARRGHPVCIPVPDGGPIMLTDHRPFAFGCSTAVFPADEIAALAEAGGRLEGLAAGEASPADAEEKHFLKVDRDEAEPETLLERAWVRLKGRREFE